jgi:predicted HNH restriction endonuclease
LVLATANGFCEACANQASFYSEDGSPFLEVHHVKMLADGGSDQIANAVALCPNCPLALSSFSRSGILCDKHISTSSAPDPAVTAAPELEG